MILDIDSVSLFRDEKPIVLPAYNHIGGCREFFLTLLYTFPEFCDKRVSTYTMYDRFLLKVLDLTRERRVYLCSSDDE